MEVFPEVSPEVSKEDLARCTQILEKVAGNLLILGSLTDRAEIRVQIHRRRVIKARRAKSPGTV